MPAGPSPWKDLHRLRSKSPNPSGSTPQLFDFHTHTVASDGVCTLEELAKLARHLGLTGLAITDHDALPETNQREKVENDVGIHLWAGVELSTEFLGRGFHLLGYAFDADHPQLQSLCEDIQAQRKQRFWTMVEQLEKQNVTFTEPFWPADRPPKSLGRRHLARALVAERYAGSHRSAVERYLHPLGDHVPAARVPLPDAINVLHQAGGVAVLAHPPTGLDDSFWPALAQAGLDGLEGRFGRAPNRHRRHLADLANQHHWFLTAGSDYHGDGPGDQLGKHTCPHIPWLPPHRPSPQPATPGSTNPADQSAKMSNPPRS